MDRRQLRRARRRRALYRQRLAVALTFCAAMVLALIGCRPETGSNRVPRVPETHLRAHHRAAPWRPLQFVVVSFDGSGGVRLWPYWRSVARRARARFTFFVSGVYLLDEVRRKLYRPPRHPRGSSDIGFAQPEDERPARALVQGMLHQIAAAYGEGHEIGTHYNGHFCAPYEGNVGQWAAADWRRELAEFYTLLFGASANNRLRSTVRLPFGRGEIVGGRTPCLEGCCRTLYPVLARLGFRYDASQVGRLGDWPKRELGLWSIPLPEIPFAGHTFNVVSMDYNFFANQTGAVDAPSSAARSIERETYVSLVRAFRRSYFGNRAPVSFGSHFETWNHWAYNRAVARFVGRVCRLPEVRCASYRDLVDWLEAQSPRGLRRVRLGRFRRLRPSLTRSALKRS